MAVASLVLGILSLVFMWIPYINILAIILAIVGIVLGALGMKQLKAAGKPSGMATAGMVMSIIGLAISVIYVIACGNLMCAACQVASIL